MSRLGNSIQSESRLVVSWGWGEGLERNVERLPMVIGFLFEVMKMFISVDIQKPLWKDEFYSKLYHYISKISYLMKKETLLSDWAHAKPPSIKIRNQTLIIFLPCSSYLGNRRDWKKSRKSLTPFSSSRQRDKTSRDVDFKMQACMLSRFSCFWLFVTPRAVAHQAPLSMGFSLQEYWSGSPALLQGIFQIQGLNLWLLCFLHWQVGSSTIWEAPDF